MDTPVFTFDSLRNTLKYRYYNVWKGKITAIDSNDRKNEENGIGALSQSGVSLGVMDLLGAKGVRSRRFLQSHHFFDPTYSYLGPDDFL
jgi:hypothetical protein